MTDYEDLRGDVTLTDLRRLEIEIEHTYGDGPEPWTLAQLVEFGFGDTPLAWQWRIWVAGRANDMFGDADPWEAAGAVTVAELIEVADYIADAITDD